MWGVQMKAKTKRQLNIIFALGLITAVLSIGRAATITKKTLNEDTTCILTWTTVQPLVTDSCIGNIIPAYYFSSFECNLGIIFACGPALRQFWAYRSRTHTSLPTKARQYPNEDFEKMRYRINMRDIFWYRKARTIGNRVFDASPIFRSRSPPPDASSSNRQSSTQVSSSILDVWEKKIRNAFRHGRDHEVILSKWSHSSRPCRQTSTNEI